MKKFLTLFVSAIFLYSLHAQVLYSTASYGGANGAGTICRLNTVTNNLTAPFSFDAPGLMAPFYNGLTQANNGKLYGMMWHGGSVDAGGIFSLDPATGTYTQLKAFDGTDGFEPYGSLIQASDGNLYGMTTQGGSKGLGVIFFLT